MHSPIIELLQETPVVAAIKDDEGLRLCLDSEAKVVFTLYGTVLDLPGLTQRIRDAGKLPVVHLDLAEGLAPRAAAVDFLAQKTAAAGVISTKPAPVRRARELGLCAIRRFFLLDSMAIRTLEKQMREDAADLVEVLPGVMPKVLARIAQNCPAPLIAGGLITDKEDVVRALSAGALAISSTNPAVWNL